MHIIIDFWEQFLFAPFVAKFTFCSVCISSIFVHHHVTVKNKFDMWLIQMRHKVCFTLLKKGELSSPSPLAPVLKIKGSDENQRQAELRFCFLRLSLPERITQGLHIETSSAATSHIGPCKQTATSHDSHKTKVMRRRRRTGRYF